MLEVPSERLSAFIRDAPTIALLDRLTAFRSGMRVDVLPLIEAELRRRGVDSERIAEHRAEIEETVIWERPGMARRCRDCERPAVAFSWDWHRLVDRLPVWPARFFYCANHIPQEHAEQPDE
jgi:hypothetical protein